MSFQIQEHLCDIRGVEINYAELASDGPPLVLVHGGSSRWQSYSQIIPELAKHWHIFAPDLRGHGKSARTTGHYRLQNYVDDMIGFLQDVVREPACLYGHSLGGIVAVMVAAQSPQGVRALGIGDAALSKETWLAAMAPMQPRLKKQRQLSGGQLLMEELIPRLKDMPIENPDGSFSTFREFFGEDWVGWNSFATDLYQNDPDMMTSVVERPDDTATGYEMERLLPAIKCPVLLLQADPQAGGVMTDAEVEQAMKLSAHGEHVKLEGVSHALHHQEPEKVVGVMLEFFLRKKV